MESRVQEALEMLADKIAKVDTKTADQIQIMGAKLSGEIKDNGAQLIKRIKTISNQCSKMETLTNSAKNTRPKLGRKMKALSEIISNKAIQFV